MNISRIKHLRKRAGMTQTQLAKYVGVSHAAVAQWESGETKNLKMQHLFKVAKALNVDAEKLVEDEPIEEVLTKDERILLDLFSQLSPRDKELAIRLLKVMK